MRIAELRRRSIDKGGETLANKRMLSLKVADSDAFLEMPPSSQALYFHFCLRADDDGFVNSPKKIQRIVGASDKDLKLLISKRYLLSFKSGVVVIKHWWLHNSLRKDRYTPTMYQDEYVTLYQKANGVYTDHPPDDAADDADMLPEWQPDGNQTETNGMTSGDIDKIRLEESRLEEDITGGGINTHACAHEDDEGAPGPGDDKSSGKNPPENPFQLSPDEQKAVSAYMDKFGNHPGGMVIEDIRLFSQHMSADLMIRAFEISVAEKKYSWSYTKGILNRYKNEGIKTVADAIVKEEERRRQKEANNGRAAGDPGKPDKAKRHLSGVTEL
jgi:DnaD/phage-associated family protein